MAFSFLFKVIKRVFPAKEALAHCDIPCGIYTVQPAKTAAETVEKMVEKIKELDPPTLQDLQGGDFSGPKNKFNSMARYIAVKEEHAELCKKELLILWTDYFKEEHLATFPDLHDKFWKATKFCSKNKQEVNLELAKALRAAVDEIAGMFERSKK